MPEFTIQPDPALWHEVPGPIGESRFVAERSAGLHGDAAQIAATMARLAVAARGTTEDLTLLLQEPQSALYAVATFSLYTDRAPAGTAKDALTLVTGGQVGPWDPTVVPVELGPVRGFRVSELHESEDEIGGSDATGLHLTQTTYVVSVGGNLGTVALSPAPSPAAGMVLALVEPVISTWEVTA
ncbi:hypothetical protein J2S40_001363 [Nocardioides luteus]|uniref:Uncharacterized protein n=1 Tax=Nocardioides luteus TaxID=1844 RepID=A0ABQ5T441_9ACTN|nr:hypothetical protein [Nocardioides luteus]MDR7310305.1 hypothetical protein [Nocardioides luteus]GGR53587.1 hypothetical protein GCM10010197_20000 [Nocardioides luteus]GLJ69916.1 hypothetical protein GCM10017579_39520 [Nocardioides luteus]